jgi:SAM-dependent methyltransferase
MQKTRSNLDAILLDDMTRTSLPDASFDGVVSIEVIEHVPDDRAFVRQIARVLRPGGWLVLSTPNGDYVKNEPPNFIPDHIRHYKKAELEALLAGSFADVNVFYAVSTGRNRVRGLRSIDPRRPLRALGTAASNVLNRLESRGVAGRATRTAHLFAVARKGGN